MLKFHHIRPNRQRRLVFPLLAVVLSALCFIGNNNVTAIQTQTVARCIDDDAPMTIWSPGNLKSYPPNTARVWLFAAEAFKCVQITFTVFDLEDSEGCAKDHVIVHDGATTAAPLLLDRLCGTAHAETSNLTTTSFKSTINAITLVFRSDSSLQRRGFEAIVRQVHCDKPKRKVRRNAAVKATVVPRCLGSIGSSMVYIKYPIKGHYRKNIHRHWAFISAPRTCIELTLKQYDMERSVECSKDFIGAYDGIGENAHMLLRMCGSSSAFARATGALPIVISSKNTISLTFESDEDITRRGFEAEIAVKQCDVTGAHSNIQGTKVLMPPENIVKIPECGLPYFGPFAHFRASAISLGRIVGGNVSVPHQWPWQASIRFHSQHTCGGSIISPRHILTAAHCFSSLSDDPLDFEVWLGKHKKEQLEPDKEQRIAVEDIKIHPDYARKAQYDSDLAILRLAQPIVMTQYKQPVCLPSLNRELPETNMTCYVSGFGATKGTGGDLFLKHAELPILDVEECGRWSENLRPHLTNNMVCAGFYEGGTDSCQGDSGGPLVCIKDEKFWLSGVVSFGIDCAKSRSPGVYVRVAKFMEWIENTAYDLVLP